MISRVVLFFIWLFILILKGDITMASVSVSDEDIQKYMLSNGMTVILDKNSAAPVVAVNVWVKTGSVCEQPGEYGIAHVHEHMLFKGTKNRPVGEIARTIEASGGDINAFTSFDETVYYVVIASRFLDTALDVLSDAMQNSTFDAEELRKELEVIQEEIRRGEDSPQRVLTKELFATAYKVHPYGRAVIGTPESVASLTREKILSFYNKWYFPDNMVLVVVGDFEEEKLKPVIENTFGKLEKRKVPPCNISEEPEQKEIRTFVVEKELNEAYFAMAFHTVSVSHEDAAVLDVISEILGNGDSSRLFRKVKEEAGLVTSVYSYSFTPKYDGLFIVGGTMLPENSEKAFFAILEQIDLLKRIPVSTDELAKAKLNIESDFVYTKETMQGQAQKLGSFEVEAGDYQFEQEYLKRVKQVSAEDIMRVAKEYFRRDGISAGILFPSGKAVFTKDSLKYMIGKGFDRIESIYVEKDFQQPGEVIKKILSNGITVLIKENHSVPLFSARAVFLGGTRFETEKTNGISNFVAEMLTRGTKSRSAEQIAREIESMAGEIEGFSGRNSIGVAVESLSRNFDRTMEIFADVIENPSFPDEEIERARKEILSAIKRQKDNMVRKAINLFLQSLFKHHPYRFDVLGTEENVTRFTKRDIQRFYERVIKPENMVLSIAGDVDSKIIIPIIEKYFAKMSATGFEPVELSPEPRPEKIEKVVSQESDKAQTHIILGFLAPNMKSDDMYAFEVMNAVLSGQGGRLFLELRDKLSLAYSVTSFYTPGLENGYFGVYIGTAPEKEEEAIEAIKTQLSLLLSNGIDDRELERAKNYLVGSFEIGLQKNSSQAAKIAFDELYGLGWEEYKKYPQKIYDVSKEDVMNVIKKYIDLQSYTVAVVRGR